MLRKAWVISDSLSLVCCFSERAARNVIFKMSQGDYLHARVKAQWLWLLFACCGFFSYVVIRKG